MTSLDGVLPAIVTRMCSTGIRGALPGPQPVRRACTGSSPRLGGDRVFPLVASRADREFVLTPRTVARPYGPRQYATDAALVPTVVGVPIDTVVHVESHWRKAFPAGGEQASAHSTAVEETRYLEDLPFGQAGGLPRLGAIVAHGDPRDHDFAETLDQQLIVSPRVRGVRLVATRHPPDPRVRDGGDADNILSSTAFLDGFAELAGRKLVFEAAVYSHQLYDVIVLAREYPDTTIVLDHFGMPAGVFGPIGTRTGATAAARADIWRLWRERITTLASYRNVVVKLSGLAMPVLATATNGGATSAGRRHSRDDLSVRRTRREPLRYRSRHVRVQLPDRPAQRRDRRTRRSPRRLRVAMGGRRGLATDLPRHRGPGLQARRRVTCRISSQVTRTPPTFVSGSVRARARRA